MTTSVIQSDSMTSREIDAAMEPRARARPIYHLDIDALREARPDLILTQEL